MPRLFIPNKKRAGIAGRQEYTRRTPTPYWTPVMEDDDDENDEDYVDEDVDEDNDNDDEQQEDDEKSAQQQPKLQPQQYRQRSESPSPKGGDRQSIKVASTSRRRRRHHDNHRVATNPRPPNSLLLLLDDDDIRFRLGRGEDKNSGMETNNKASTTSQQQQRRTKRSNVIPNQLQRRVSVAALERRNQKEAKQNQDDGDKKKEYQDHPFPNVDNGNVLVRTSPSSSKQQKRSPASKPTSSTRHSHQAVIQPPVRSKDNDIDGDEEVEFDDELQDDDVNDDNVHEDDNNVTMPDAQRRVDNTMDVEYETTAAAATTTNTNHHRTSSPAKHMPLPTASDLSSSRPTPTTIRESTINSQALSPSDRNGISFITSATATTKGPKSPPKRRTATPSTRPSSHMTQVVVVTAAASPRGMNMKTLQQQYQGDTQHSPAPAAPSSAERTTTTKNTTATPQTKTRRHQDGGSQQKPQFPSLLDATAERAMMYENIVEQQQQQRPPKSPPPQPQLSLSKHSSTNKKEMQQRNTQALLQQKIASERPHQSNQQTKLLSTTSPTADTKSPPVATSRSRTRLDNDMPKPNEATAAAAGAAINSEVASKNNPDTGCCTCCNCLRRAQGHKQDRMEEDGGDHNQDVDDNVDDYDNAFTCPRQNPKYEEMVEVWMDLNTRLIALSKHVERLTRAVFPPEETLSSSGMAPYRRSPPFLERPVQRRRRRRVFIDDDHDDDEEVEKAYWDDYRDDFGRQPRRAQSWSGHHSRPYVTSYDNLPVERNMDQSQQRRLIRGGGGFNFLAPNDERPLPSPTAHHFRRSSSSSSRRSDYDRRVPATATFSHYQYDDVHDDQGLFETQPYQHHPRFYGSQRERLPSYERVSSDALPASNHDENLDMEDVHEEREVTSSEHIQKKRRLERENLPELPLSRKVVIDICDSDNGNADDCEEEAPQNSAPKDKATSVTTPVRSATASQQAASNDNDRKQGSGKSQRDVISLADDDESSSSSDGDELIPVVLPMARENVLAALQPLKSQQQATLKEQKEMRSEPTKPGEYDGNRPDDDTIRFLDDFLSDQKVQSERRDTDVVHEEKVESKLGGHAVTESKLAEQQEPLTAHVSAKRNEPLISKVSQCISRDEREASSGQSAVAADVGTQHDEEASTAKSDLGMPLEEASRQKKSSPKSPQTDGQMFPGGSKDPSPRVEVGKKHHSRFAQEVSGRNGRGSEFAMVEAASLQALQQQQQQQQHPRTPARTSSRKLRDVVPTFDSLVTYGMRRVNSSLPSKKHF